MSDSVMGSGITPNYDSFNRLSAINYGSSGLAFSYTYDRYGNRWSQTATQGSGPSPQVSFNVNTNQNTSMGYDAAGNMTSDRTHSYYYDAEGNIVSVDSGATATTYVYDASNHRVRVTTPSADTYYTFNTDGLRVASWSASSPTPTLLAAYSYWNGRPVATYTAGTVNYPQLDLLGTKRLITDSNGNQTVSFQSLPFGDNFAFNGTGTDSDPSHFALLDHDTESGTEHAQARQYSSTPGAWMSPDPYDGSYSFGAPQTLNRYTYASNNPLSYIDPSGQFDCSAYNSSADAAALAQCQQAAGLAAAAAGPNCSTTISAACSSAPTNPTLEGEWAIAAYESYSLHEGDRAEAEYVSRVDEVYWEDQAISQNAPSNPNCSGSNAQLVANASIAALSQLNPTQDETNNITPRDGDFANVVVPSLINTTTWTAAATMHGTSLQSPTIPGQNTFVVKLYNDPNRGNIIAVVYPNGTIPHILGTIPFALHIGGVNVGAALAYLGCPAT